MSVENNTEKISLKKGLVTTAILAAFSVGIIALCTAFGLSSWIVFLGLTLWGAFGAPVASFSDVAGPWLSAAVGLAISFLIHNGGTAGLVIGVVLVLALVLFMVLKRLHFICNPYCAAYLTVGTAIHIDPLPFALSVALGFVAVGLIPFVIVKLITKRKTTEAAATAISAK